MRKLGRIVAVAVTTAAALLVTALPAQAEADAEALDYVALGDSYSSGTGTREYVDTTCQRSDHSYPAQLAAERGYSLSFDACSGATIDDVRSKQLGNLSADTGLVTISAGGNDTGWTNVVASCARPWPWNCWDDIDQANAFIANELPGMLDALYGDIRGAAPNAQVIVVGYPRLFNGETCNVVARISAEEQRRLNESADLLSDAIAAAAAGHGFDYVDARAPFAGHAVCDDEEWINGLSNPIGESYHPNRNGHDAYTGEVARLL